MNRIFLIPVLLFSSILASAQFKKNDILLGGNLSYSYNSVNYKFLPNGQNDYKTNSGNFTVDFGKALNENTIAGLTLSYLPYSNNNYSIDAGIPIKYHDNGYAVGIFYRKYKSLGKDFYFFGQAAALYNWSNESGKDSTGKELLTGSSWSVGMDFIPGIAYKISKHFFLELSLNELFSVRYFKTHTNTPQTKSENDMLNISSSLSTGFLANLGIGMRLIL